MGHFKLDITFLYKVNVNQICLLLNNRYNILNTFLNQVAKNMKDYKNDEGNGIKTSYISQNQDFGLNRLSMYTEFIGQ